MREKRIMQNKKRLRELSDSIKHKHIYHRGPRRRRRREKGAENLFEEIRAENFPNLEKERYPDPGSTENHEQNQQNRHQEIL